MINIHDHQPWLTFMTNLHNQPPCPTSIINFHDQYPWSPTMINIHNHQPWSTSMIIIHNQHPRSTSMINIQDQHPWSQGTCKSSYNATPFHTHSDYHHQSKGVKMCVRDGEIRVLAVWPGRCTWCIKKFNVEFHCNLQPHPWVKNWKEELPEWQKRCPQISTAGKQLERWLSG